MVQSKAEYEKGLEVGMEDAAGALRSRVWLQQGSPGGEEWETRLGRWAGSRS